MRSGFSRAQLLLQLRPYLSQLQAQSEISQGVSHAGALLQQLNCFSSMQNAQFLKAVCLALIKMSSYMNKDTMEF